MVSNKIELSHHDHGKPPFRTLIFLSNALYFSMYRPCTAFVKFIPKYFIFLLLFTCFLKFQFPIVEWLYIEIKIDIYILIFYPATLLNSLINPSNILIDFIGLFTEMFMLSLNLKSFTLLFQHGYLPFVFLTLLHWFEHPEQCWIEGMIADIFVLLLILGVNIHSFTIRCRFSVDALYWFEKEFLVCWFFL